MKDFDLACLELKQNGKGYNKNYEEIEDEGKYSDISTINIHFWSLYHLLLVLTEGISQKVNFVADAQLSNFIVMSLEKFQD